jgi:hypothetical protein
MTGPAMVKVEYEELIVRAAELERPITDSQGRGIPAENPQPPCALAISSANVKKAAEVLRDGSDDMRRYLTEFETVRKVLAQSLRNAAKAYRAVDEEAADAVRSLTPMTAVALDAVDAGSPSAARFGAVVPAATSDPSADEIYDGLHTVEQIAQQLEQLDQGASLDRFADQWANYKDALRRARDRFRPFQEWTGDASSAVVANFDSQRRWLDSMASLSGQLATQAQTVVDEFRSLRKQHVYATDIRDARRKKFDYQQLMAVEQYLRNPPGSLSLSGVMKFYNEVTQNSSTLVTDFRGKAGLPLSQVNPMSPPAGAKVDPPKPWKPVPRPSDEDIHKAHIIKPAKRPTDEEIWNDRIIKPVPRPWIKGDDDVPVTPDAGGGEGYPSGPTMPTMPMMPSMPATPQATDPQLAEALKDLKSQGTPHLPHTGGGVKPASVGGGGVPAMPLQPWTDGEATARPAAAGAGAGNLGRGVPGVGGAMGGGMPAGGAPGQGGDKGSKGKRIQGEEEQSLYTEDREWTEGVIGLRSAKEAPKH